MTFLQVSPRTASTVLLLFAVTISHVWAMPIICPDFRESLGCNTGPCSNEGVEGNFLAPSTSLRGKLVKFIPGAEPARCFDSCSRQKKCALWQWRKTKESKGQVAGECYLYPSGMFPECSATYNTTVGIKCGGAACHDPHFVGAHGTRYDFNGQPGKSFCLVSDTRLHINMKMTGYFDQRTESASLVVGGKAVRTWIRELGILWISREEEGDEEREEEGEEHSLLLAAREGGETGRAEGFLEKLEIDGERVGRMEEGGERRMAGGLRVTFVGVEKKGIFDVDVYSVEIKGLVHMTLHLRVAHPLLQRPEDAETHISVAFNWIKTTPTIHGVLGQTYRDGREERTRIYSKLSAVLKTPISADGENGKGFLDGETNDYVSSNVLKPDCRFSTFKGRELPASSIF